MTSLLGIQIPAPERAAEPPNVGAFSTTTTRRPRLAARSAAVMPAAPAPTMTTSYCELSAWAGPLAAAELTTVLAPTAAAPASTCRRLSDAGMRGPSGCAAMAPEQRWGRALRGAVHRSRPVPAASQQPGNVTVTRSTIRPEGLDVKEKFR